MSSGEAANPPSTTSVSCSVRSALLFLTAPLAPLRFSSSALASSFCNLWVAFFLSLSPASLYAFATGNRSATRLAAGTAALTAWINPAYKSVPARLLVVFQRTGRRCKNGWLVCCFLAGNTPTPFTSPRASRAVTLAIKSRCPFRRAISSLPRRANLRYSAQAPCFATRLSMPPATAS